MEDHSMFFMFSGLVFWVLTFLLMVLIHWQCPTKKTVFNLMRIFVGAIMGIGISFVFVIARQDYSLYPGMALVMFSVLITNVFALRIAGWLPSQKN